MLKLYENYQPLILGATLSGLYFPPVENLIARKWILWILRCLPAVPIIFLPMCVLAEVKYLLLDEGTFLPKLYTLTAASFFLLSTFLVFSFYSNRYKYVKLFEMVQLATEEGLHEELIKDRSKFTNKWPIVLLPLSVMCGSFYSMGTYFNENKDLGHPSGFPYRHQFPDFEIVTTIELISGIAGFMILIGFDSMIMTLFSLEEIQLLHLKESLYQITNCDPAFIIINKNDNYRALSLRQQEQPSTSELEENIRIWCIRHQNTLKFHDELQNLFGPALSLKNILLVLTFCIIGFFNAVRIAPTKDLVAAACYVLTSSLLYYVNATFADSIHDANQTIFDDAFGNNWHQFPPHILSSIRIIQIRAQRALQFMTLKIYPLNSGTFLTVLYTTYTIFTFLLQIM